jgi:6-phosphogluconate dehydrogenase (decarboxylating)
LHRQNEGRREEVIDGGEKSRHIIERVENLLTVGADMLDIDFSGGRNGIPRGIEKNGYGGGDLVIREGKTDF